MSGQHGRVTDMAVASTMRGHGLPTMKDKLTRYRRMSDACSAIINDLKNARTQAQLWDNVVLGVTLTIGVCDAVVSVLGELTPAGGKWKNVYEVGKNVGAGAGSAYVGDRSGAAASMMKGAAAGGGAKHAAGKGGLTHGQHAMFEAGVDLHAAMLNSVIDAANKGGKLEDEDKIKALMGLGAVTASTAQKLAHDRSAQKVLGTLKGMAAPGSRLASELRKAQKFAGKVGTGKLVNVASGVGQAYVDADKAIRDHAKSGADNDEYFSELKGNMVARLKDINAHIVLLKAQLYQAEFQQLMKANPGQAGAIKMQSRLDNRV